MSPLRVLAVDDERPALDDLTRMLHGHAAIGEVATAASGSEALGELAQRPYDAVFLDVRMPGIDGVELARVLRRFEAPPTLVFVSAYESAAVQAFELRAVDYLMKPVSRARLDDAVARVQSERAPAPEAESDVVPVDTQRGGTRLLPRSSILYLQAYGDYVRIVADDGRFLMRGRLSEIERRWEPFGFVRVHRRYLVNLRRAVEVRPQLNGTALLVFRGGGEVPVARRQVADLRRRLKA